MKRLLVRAANVPNDSFFVRMADSREETIKRFLKESKPTDLLLVDAETHSQTGCVPASSQLARSWLNRNERRLHTMKPCMEAWFLAQPRVLIDYFDRSLPKQFPPRVSFESTPKRDVLSALKALGYHKADDSPKLLDRVAESAVAEISRGGCFWRLIQALREPAS